MPDQPPTPATDAVKSLTEFLCEAPAEHLTTEQTQAELRKASVDLNSLKRRVQASLMQAKGQQRLAAARSLRISMAERFAKMLTDQPIAQAKAQIIHALQERFGASNEMTVVYRKFEDSSDADLNSLLEDMALLDDMDDSE